MATDRLKERTKAFALRVIKLASSLPSTPPGRVIGDQILRSGTSVGANYRAATRVKSTADFIHKMGTVEEEAGERMYWMELIVEAGMMGQEKLSDLYREADELLAIVVTSIKSAKQNRS